MAQADSFESGNISVKDEQMIIDEMKLISARLGKGLPIKTILPEIIESIIKT
jgi:hypothetical protein